MRPFAEETLQFCERLSQQLFEQTSHPELLALAFWLRKSHIEELRERFNALQRPGERLVPRGLAFHIAPGNVETLFVYSWILSLLVGNANVVRLPSRESAATRQLFTILEQLLAEKRFEEIAKNTTLLSYGHEEAITASLSQKADVRLIWGGDETIKTIRQIPLKVTGKELLFADRYALAAFQAEAYLQTAEKESIAERFYRDLFWYDQQTCASPRMLCWIGSEETCRKASQELYQRLEKLLQKRQYALPLAGRLQKLTELYRAAILLPMRRQEAFGALTVVELEAFDPACRSFGGFGLLFHLVLPKLESLAEIIVPQDQTLSHWGFALEELTQLASMLNGRGLDRLVPVGQALQFDAVWDGYDLLAELSKRVVITHE